MNYLDNSWDVIMVKWREIFNRLLLIYGIAVLVIIYAICNIRWKKECMIIYFRDLF